MLELYENLIKPKNDALATMLRIHKVEIKHRGYTLPITVQQKENGIVMDCNHAGHGVDEVESEELVFDEYESNVFPRYNKRKVFACDKCMAISDDGEDWYE